MNKKKLNILLQGSYKNDVLDNNNVTIIANLLKRQDLKQYINALKNYESKNSVIVSFPFTPKYIDKEMFEKIFPNKQIVVKIDASLILGIKIENGDLVYEANLKNSLSQIISAIQQSYD